MGTSCPVELECTTPPSMWMCSPTWKHSEAHGSEFFMEVSSWRDDWLLDWLFTQSPAPLPSLEDRIGWDFKFQASNHNLVFFWRPAPILKLSRSLPRVSTLGKKKKCSYCPGISKLSRSSVSGTRGRDQIYILLCHRKTFWIIAWSNYLRKSSFLLVKESFFWYLLILTLWFSNLFSFNSQCPIHLKKNEVSPIQVKYVLAGVGLKVW